jgi:hypothetical protein
MSEAPASQSTSAALAATRSIRSSRGYQALSASEQASLERDLTRIEHALGAPDEAFAAQRATSDPFAVPLETPFATRGVGGFPGAPAPRPGGGGGMAPVQPPAPPAQPPRPPTSTEVIGARARQVLDAVDFPSFVAGLIHGTFQSIVDATAKQVREYAKLVADLSRSVDDFTRDNVSVYQAYDWLADRHPQELELILPRPGQNVPPRLVPRGAGNERSRGRPSSPAWLEQYGLGGEELTPELVQGPLVQAARRSMGEDRMRTLATLVLMGINRIVIDDGQLRAKLQFHAKAQEKLTADIAMKTGGQELGIAAQQSGMRTVVTTMVSTVDVNAQSDISIKADLVGEVSVRFRTETFDLQRFADSQAIELINRHAGQRSSAAPAPAPAAAPSAPAPASTAPAPAAPSPPLERGGNAP